MAGVDRLADAVQVTLGPKGRQVIIEQPFGGPKITKDGVSVARALEFEDRYQNVGANLVKQVASSTNDVAGDGTTTATVLTRAILAEGLKSVAAGMNPMDLRRGIQRGVERVVADLQGRATKISSTEEIAQVATISANGDAEVGNLIASAMDKVGKEGVITVAVRSPSPFELPAPTPQALPPLPPPLPPPSLPPPPRARNGRPPLPTSLFQSGSDDKFCALHSSEADARSGAVPLLLRPGAPLIVIVTPPRVSWGGGGGGGEGRGGDGMG